MAITPRLIRRFRRRFSMGLAIASVFLVIIELGLRLAIPEENLLFSWEKPNGLLAYEAAGTQAGQQPVIGVRPNAQVNGPVFGHQSSWRAQTNAFGMRESYNPSLEKPPNTLRVLTVGDSWAFGFGNRDGRTLSDQLEVRLARARGVTVEVLNAGIPGGAAIDMLRRWQGFGMSFKVDAVFMVIPHNYRPVTDRAAWYRHAPGAPISRLRTILYLRWALMNMRVPMFAPGVPEGTSDTAVTVQDLAEIARRARAVGVDVWFLDAPDGFGPLTNKMEPSNPRLQHFHSSIVNAVDDEGAIVASHTLAERSCWQDEDLNHPSDRGVEVLADAMVHAIIDGRSATKPNLTPCTEQTVRQ